MAPPLASVLVTTRDGAAWIRQTLDSVLAQDLADFELVVVDDASTDATPAILAATTDPRLRVIRHGTAVGIAAGRNIGIAACRAPYIAVLDHDDISLPGRLSAQVAFLDAHPGTVLVGTAASILRNGRASCSGQPRTVGAAGLRMLLHLGNPLTWSSVMFRRSALLAVARDGRVLDPAFEPADDFELYHRLMGLGAVARLDGVLTQYRWHATNTTHRLAARIDGRAAAVLSCAYQGLGYAGPGEAAVLAIRHLSNRERVPDAATLDRVLALIDRTAEACGGPDGLAGAMRWSVLRAAIRDGRFWLALKRPSSLGGPGDVAVSMGVGLLRWLRRLAART